MQNAFKKRQNLVHRTLELWRPPVFAIDGGRWQKLKAAIRRYFDLQAGSAWTDLCAELPKVSGTIIDVGCGAQPFRNLIPSQAKYIGIDTIDAKSNFGYDVPDTIYFSGDTWPIENESVDSVLCSETLEHVLEPDLFLKEMHRCLRSQGRVILTVPFAARWHFIPYDYWRFTPASLNHLLSKAGFIGIKVYARGNAVTVACYKVMALILSLLLSQSPHRFHVVIYRIVGLLTSPGLIILATIANISLKMQGGDDCLGYTVLANRD
jgi:SAM-dependent methyltransferase